MKKLLCVLMFGMVFGQTVSQKLVEVAINDHSNVEVFTLSDLFPQYSIEWALINIIGCETEECRLAIYYDIGNGNSDSDSQTQHYLRNSNEGAFNEYYYYYSGGGNSSTFYVAGGQDFSITSSETPSNVKLLVTAEFPEEDTGYIEEGFDYCIEEGANLVASPCRDEMDIIDTLPSEIADNLNGIIGQGVAATNQNGNWVGSLSGLGGGNGYWLQSNVNACFNYNCAEN